MPVVVGNGADSGNPEWHLKGQALRSWRSNHRFVSWCFSLYPRRRFDIQPGVLRLELDHDTGPDCFLVRFSCPGFGGSFSDQAAMSLGEDEIFALLAQVYASDRILSLQ